MAYFVTGATGFIGRHLLERLLEREGDIHVLVRAGSQERLDALVERLGAGAAARVKPVIGDLQEPRLGVSEEQIAALEGQIEHFFHLAAMYDMTAAEEVNERLNVVGTRNAVDLAAALGAGHLHHVSSVAAAGEFKGLFREDMFDEGQKLPVGLSPHEVRLREARPRAVLRAVARVPPSDRRRPLADRRDGQDRRALLLLQGDPEGALRAAGVDAAHRPRARLHEHRAGRLRRRRAGPHRPSARPRRPGLPPHQPQADARRRVAQRVRQGRPRAAAGDPRRQAPDRRAAQGHACRCS